MKDILKMNIELPRQLDTGIKEEEVKDQAKQGISSASGVIVVQVLLQIVLKGAIDPLFDLYLKLQLINGLRKFDIYQSAVVDIYFE